MLHVLLASNVTIPSPVLPDLQSTPDTLVCCTWARRSLNPPQYDYTVEELSCCCAENNRLKAANAGLYAAAAAAAVHAADSRWHMSTWLRPVTEEDRMAAEQKRLRDREGVLDSSNLGSNNAWRHSFAIHQVIMRA